MKLIDRYLLRTLWVPLVYCLAAFILIYVVFDLFNNLSDFLESQTPLREILLFYALLLPSVLIYIVPVSLLMAVLYSLAQLTRHNELTAMRASGISLYRLMRPFVMTGVGASLLVAVVHETIAPQSSYWCHQFLAELGRTEGRTPTYIVENMAYKNVRTGRIWMIRRFNTRTFEMQHIEVIQQRPDGSDASRINALRGLWLDGRWWFTDLRVQEFGAEGHPLGPPRSERRREMTEITEEPRDFLNMIKDPQFLSSRDILGFLRTHEHLSADTLARTRVDMHHRLAMPWASLVVTLLGIPFGHQTARRGAILGVILSLSLFFALYITINIGLAMGKEQHLAAWLGGWFPLLLFFAIGCVLANRMR